MIVRIETDDTLIEGPSVEPIDLDETKKACRISATDEDTLMDTWIPSARLLFEKQTGMQLMDATWELGLAAAPCQSVIELPHPPLLDVVSVTYDDDDGVEQTFDADSYQVVVPAAGSARGYIALVSDASWPTIPAKRNALRIRYRAGFGSAPGAVPELIKGALYALVERFSERELTVDQASDSILAMIVREFKYTALPKYPPPTYSAWSVQP